MAVANGRIDTEPEEKIPAGVDSVDLCVETLPGPVVPSAGAWEQHQQLPANYATVFLLSPLQEHICMTASKATRKQNMHQAHMCKGMSELKRTGRGRVIDRA